MNHNLFYKIKLHYSSLNINIIIKKILQNNDANAYY